MGARRRHCLLSLKSKKSRHQIYNFQGILTGTLHCGLEFLLAALTTQIKEPGQQEKMLNLTTMEHPNAKWNPWLLIWNIFYHKKHSAHDQIYLKFHVNKPLGIRKYN